jgi:hypothetical protein
LTIKIVIFNAKNIENNFIFMAKLWLQKIRLIFYEYILVTKNKLFSTTNNLFSAVFDAKQSDYIHEAGYVRSSACTGIQTSCPAKLEHVYGLILV